MPPMVTLSNYARSWLATQLGLRPTTRANYEQALRLHILPPLGELVLPSVTRTVVKNALANVLKAGLAPGTVRFVLAVLRSCLGAAVEDGLLLANPASGLARAIRLPKHPRPVQALDAEQLARFLDTAETLALQLFPLFLTLARAGLRLGEALALDWSAVSLAERRLRIAASYTRGRIGPTKSGRTRDVDMSQQLVRCLAGLERSVGWVFPSPRTGGPYSARYVTAAMHRVCRSAALPAHFSPRNLRHSFASLLLSGGASVAFVQRQLGHASIQLTVDLYGRWLSMRCLEAVDRLDALR